MTTPSLCDASRSSVRRIAFQRPLPFTHFSHCTRPWDQGMAAACPRYLNSSAEPARSRHRRAYWIHSKTVTIRLTYLIPLSCSRGIVCQDPRGSTAVSAERRGGSGVAARALSELVLAFPNPNFSARGVDCIDPGRHRCCHACHFRRVLNSCACVYKSL